MSRTNASQDILWKKKQSKRMKRSYKERSRLSINRQRNAISQALKELCKRKGRLGSFTRHSKESRLAISRAQKRLGKTLGKIRRVNAIKSWKNKKVREKRLKAMATAWRQSPNKQEKLIAKVLRRLKVKYKFQYTVGHYIADFYIPAEKLLIECNGIYWHSRSEVRLKDKRKIRLYRKKGFRILVISCPGTGLKQKVVEKKILKACLKGVLNGE